MQSNAAKNGLIAEQIFTVRALKQGLKISRPLSPSSRYDFIIDKDGELFSVQVKSCFSPVAKGTNSYRIKTSRTSYRKKEGRAGCKVYKEGAFDFFAVYIEELDVFYIIPFEIAPEHTLRIDKDPTKGPYVVFRENWDFKKLDLRQ